MLKFGESCNVYMKRVWIFDETLSPACFIYYYTLASPAGNSVSSYMCGTILFPSQRASKAAPGMCGKERVNKGFSGRKEAGENFIFPLSPFPFSLTLFPLCPRPPGGQNVPLVLPTL